LDIFAKNALLRMDESHTTVTQVNGMYEGKRSRKTTLVEHGFRLPSALDNRPLKFEEFMKMTDQRVYVSATPGPFELMNSRPENKTFVSWKRDAKMSANQVMRGLRKKVKPSPSSQRVDDFEVEKRGASLVTEQIIRPTGLLDPVLTMYPLRGQIDKTIELCRDRVAKQERVLVTTLTKKTAEDLAEYLQGIDLSVRYIHSDVDAIERVEILRALRAGDIEVLVGINLLREGLDLPEVSLVCILDADKEGFLRNETSLVQTAGRAARHVNGECVLFCDTVTDSIQALLDVTKYRREKQIAYNEKHGITPRSVVRSVQKTLKQYAQEEEISDVNALLVAEDEESYNVLHVISELEEEMRAAAGKLEFERAAHLRDQISDLKKRQEQNARQKE